MILSKKSRKRFILVLILLFITASVITWWFKSNSGTGRYRDFLTAIYVMGFVKLEYYQPTSLEKLFNAYWKAGNIEGMLKSLNDPYTRFLNKTEFAELKKETKGSFGGIGIYLIPKENELLISSVVENTPGHRAGLQQGDRIIAVGEIPVEKLGTEGAVAKIRGPAGTELSLTIVRGEGANRRQFTIQIVRENIVIPTVNLKIESDSVIGNYAVLKIQQFSETTADDVKQKLQEVNDHACKALILDLRANPGGLLDAAIKVVSQFLPSNTAVIHVFRKGIPINTYNTKNNGDFTRIPMVVLVDHWSASASEIVAGALKDQNRAKLIGTNTYGKDLIQQIKELPGGVGVSITIASYLTSGKVNIHRVGIKPHRTIEIPGALDELMEQGNPQKYLMMQEMQEKEAIKALRQEILHIAPTTGFNRFKNNYLNELDSWIRKTA